MSKTLRIDYYEIGMISVNGSEEYLGVEDFFNKYGAEVFNGNRPKTIEVEYHGVFSVLRKREMEGWKKGVLGEKAKNDK